MMYAWAGITSAITNGGGSTAAGYRGPSGAYGGVASETRAAAWTMRGRAETAFAAPDGTPEEAHFTYLTNDAPARWGGGLKITGTSFDNSAEKVWGAKYGNSYSTNPVIPLSPVNGQPPVLGNWGSDCDGAATPPLCGYTAAEQTSWGMKVVAAGSFDDPWMMWYVQYALGRVAELGFASQALQLYTGHYIIGMIGSSAPILVAQYHIPLILGEPMSEVSEAKSANRDEASRLARLGELGQSRHDCEREVGTVSSDFGCRGDAAWPTCGVSNGFGAPSCPELRRGSRLGGDVLLWLSDGQGGYPYQQCQPDRRQHRQGDAPMRRSTEPDSAAGVSRSAAPSGTWLG